MRSPTLALAAVLLASCASAKMTPIADIPKLASLEEVMDNQATASDPQFKKIGQSQFNDHELADLARAVDVINATSTKTHDFAKGRPEFDALATKVNDKSKALSAAVTAKDAGGINAALKEMKATCKECHSKFR